MISNKKLNIKYKRGTKGVDPPGGITTDGAFPSMSYEDRVDKFKPSVLNTGKNVYRSNAYEDGLPVFNLSNPLDIQDKAPSQARIAATRRRLTDPSLPTYDPEVAKYVANEEAQISNLKATQRARASSENSVKGIGSVLGLSALTAPLVLGAAAVASTPGALALAQNARGLRASAVRTAKGIFNDLTSPDPFTLTTVNSLVAPALNSLTQRPYKQYAEGIQQVYVPQVPTVDTFGNVTSLAATGGQLGGPIGAGIGAVLGGGLSLFQAKQNKKIKRQAEQAERINEAAQFTSQFQTQDAMTLPTAQDGMQIVNTIPIEIEGGELILKRSDSRPDGQMIKTTYTLKTKVPKGRKHSEGGIIYNAESGDIVIPANKAAMIEEALQRRDNMFIETEVAKLPTEGIKAKGGLNLGGLITQFITNSPTETKEEKDPSKFTQAINNFFKGAPTDPNSLDAKPLTGFQQANQLVPGISNLLSKDSPQFQPQLYRPDQLQFESVLPEQQRIINEQFNQQVGQINNLATGQQRQVALNLANKQASDRRREEVLRDNQGRLNIRNQNTQLNNQAQQINNQAIDRATMLNLQTLADDRDRRRAGLQQLSLAGRDIIGYNRDVDNMNRQNRFNEQLFGLYSPYGKVNTRTGSIGYTNMTPPSQPVNPVQSFLDQYLLNQQNKFVGPGF